ncbi:MAG: peptidoglycan-binding domain-containing protein [Candidatus Paceibacterota bacterium]|jgi:hypothetical protein
MNRLVLNILKITLFGLIFLFTFVADSHKADAFSFERTLKMGMTGEDVRELQKILNKDPRTTVSSVSYGSLGQETTYFGNLTHLAVIRFQELYPNDILKPNDLSRGTGIVGNSTRKVLNGTISVTKPFPVVVAPVVSNENLDNTNNDTDIASTSNPENPNLKNIDKFISAVETVSLKKGIAKSEIEKIKSLIYRDVATSTNLQETFIDLVENNISYYIPKESPVRPLLSRILAKLNWTVEPKIANAQTTGSPFGGAILFSFYCSCSQNWLITLTPLPPTYPALLTYMTGTQAFLSYNIPFTVWLLGEYMPGAGQCSVFAGTGCVSISSEGAITPMVGSSL